MQGLANFFCKGLDKIFWALWAKMQIIKIYNKKVIFHKFFIDEIKNIITKYNFFVKQSTN